MNLFYLDEAPDLCARYHMDKHVVKMPLEAAQILCTTHWISRVIGNAPRPLNSNELKVLREAVRTNERGSNIPYKPTHPNHPSVVWARTNIANYDWALGYLYAVSDEYTYRYGKYHKSTEAMAMLGYPFNVPYSDDMTPFALAMPDQYKSDDPVTSYRQYYIHEKAHLASWKHRETPEWFLTN